MPALASDVGPSHATRELSRLFGMVVQVRLSILLCNARDPSTMMYLPSIVIRPTGARFPPATEELIRSGLFSIERLDRIDAAIALDVIMDLD